MSAACAGGTKMETNHVTHGPRICRLQLQGTRVATGKSQRICRARGRISPAQDEHPDIAVTFPVSSTIRVETGSRSRYLFLDACGVVSSRSFGTIRASSMRHACETPVPQQAYWKFVREARVTVMLTKLAEPTAKVHLTLRCRICRGVSDTWCQRLSPAMVDEIPQRLHAEQASSSGLAPLCSDSPGSHRLASASQRGTDRRWNPGDGSQWQPCCSALKIRVWRCSPWPGSPV